MGDLWYVRAYFEEAGDPVYLDDGPWERHLAEPVLADVGVDASIPRGTGRVTVERAVLVPAA